MLKTNLTNNEKFWAAFWKALAICGAYGACFFIDYASNEVKKYLIKEIV